MQLLAGIAVQINNDTANAKRGVMPVTARLTPPNLTSALRRAKAQRTSRPATQTAIRALTMRPAGSVI